MIRQLVGTPVRKLLIVLLAVVLAMSGFAGVAGAKPKGKVSKILSSVVSRGELHCGISGGAPGFSMETAPGVYEGFDVEMCRAVAAAVLGDADAVVFVPLSARERFSALADGTVDVVMRNTTDTLVRDALAVHGGAGANFGPTYFYDGQGLMVSGDLALGGITPDSTIGDLPAFTRVCLPTGTTLESNFSTAASAAGLTFDPIPVESVGEAIYKLTIGGCDVVTTDRSFLAGIRFFEISGGNPDADDWVILKQMIAKEPLAPVVADGDDGWLAVVRWSVLATFFAEEAGIDSTNIDTQKNDTLKISRVFGDEASATGGPLKLDDEWAYNVIKQVGNYGEIYDAHLEPVGLVRAGTLNASYLDGGLIYAPPMR